MNVASILQACERQGVALVVKDDHLHIQAPKGVLSANTLDFIKKYKEGIKEHLLTTLSSRSSLSCYSTVSDDQQEAYEERAAIMEYDGGLSRAEAERAAQQLDHHVYHRPHT
ncbi:MAG: hypothetical protein L3K52_13505 [Candidatus Thiothrix sulfatifontis]|nr:MAG: hypothetical protein L3K52_13505 [Candidatus Thiothrix sulfatifontis]